MLAAVALVVGVLLAAPALSAENAVSFYLPGSHGPLAGVTPPEGVYFENDAYYYYGKIGGNVQTPLNGNLAINVKGKVWFELASFLWVTPADILGGDLALSVAVPYGWPGTSASIVVNSPRFSRPIGVTVRDTLSTVGDPIVGALLGWKSGNFHWLVGTTANVPVGDYRPDDLVNVSLNHWAADFYGAFTYLDPAVGIDLSGTAGFIVNGQNPATDYRTGNEFHADLTLSKSLTKDLSIGAMAFYYQQVTGDTGPGATAGPFKGKTTGVGGFLGYNFTLGQLPVSTRIKVYREIDVENRPEGAGAYFTVSFPLYVVTKAATAEQHAPIVRKP